MKTRIKALLRIAAALALAGAIGKAVAMSPIVQPPIKWAGGAEFNNFISGRVSVYTVPPGRNFILTDLVIGNPSGTSQSFNVYGGTSCETASLRMQLVVVPPNDTAYLALQTGIGFTAGQVVCLITTASMSVNGRGFLFTAN